MIDLNNLPQGLPLNIYRHPLGDFTLGGVSSARKLTLVGYVKPGEKDVRPLPRQSQAFAVQDDAPAVVMVESNLRGALPHLVPVGEFLAGKWLQAGGNHAGGDSRFGELIEREFSGPRCVSLLPVHDRIES
uniref:Tail terminator n=1 Tax=Mycobacterium phage Pharb TaxID=3136626 RepID=A0AAU8GSP8_9VIRU